MPARPGEVLLSEAQAKLGIWNRTMAEETVDVAQLVVADEFRRPGSGLNFRERAIDRLVGLPYRWQSEENTVDQMARRFLSMSCTRCGGETSIRNSGGSGGTTTTTTFSCVACGQVVRLMLAHDAFEVMEHGPSLEAE